MERTVLEERDALSMERLASITKEHTAQEPLGIISEKRLLLL